jgi:hypothetical protein
MGKLDRGVRECNCKVANILIRDRKQACTITSMSLSLAGTKLIFSEFKVQMHGLEMHPCYITKGKGLVSL